MSACGPPPTECEGYASRHCAKFSACVERIDVPLCERELLEILEADGAKQEQCGIARETIDKMTCAEFRASIND